MGVNQSYQGVRTAQALINLALMTGHIGRPGTGPNSITGQCNAMGSRIFGNTSSLLGGRDFSKPEDRAAVARLLPVDESRIAHSVGYTYPQILDAVKRGEIKGLWIAGTNPATRGSNVAASTSCGSNSNSCVCRTCTRPP